MNKQRNAVMLAISGAAAGTIGVIVCVRSGQWHNTATTAFAAAAVLMASANLYWRHQLVHATIEGPGVPRWCAVADANPAHLILTCPVRVAMPPATH